MVMVDNKIALRQLELATEGIFQRNASTPGHGRSIAKDGLFHPRVLTLVCTYESMRVFIS
jgi:hypothetical protein